MNNSLYNSPLEMAARLAAILDARSHMTRNERELAAIDFLTTNAGQFGLYPANLHGDSIYVATEFAARIQYINKGIRYAVAHGIITPIKTDAEIEFTLSDQGQDFVGRLSSQYLTDYMRALNPVLVYVDSRTDREVIHRIEEQGVEPIKEDRT